MKKLTIGKNVKTIGNGAFGYNKLETLTIWDKVTTIGNSAFYGNQLKTLTFPDSVQTIGKAIRCPALGSTTITSWEVHTSYYFARRVVEL